MRILVTGGSGFVGSAFINAALSCGHEIGALSRAPRLSRSQNERWFAGSVAAPPWPEIEEFAPELCIHAAWVATPGVYLESPENYDWLRWSADFLARTRHFGVRHIVSLGTCIEYQIDGQILQEDSAGLAPVSNYARCKHALHLQLRSALANPGLTVTWARLFYPYGPGEHPARLVSSLIRKLSAGETVVLNTPHSVKDYIHVDDVAAALLVLVERRFDGSVNLGTGLGVTVESIARRVAALCGRSELLHTADTQSADPLDFVVADATRLRSFGWRPEVELDTGLARLIEARRQ